ncbi:MAG: ATP-binding cassette domain-containing protein [Polyangiaceae bacterium]|nr:ATP-binding cassette domain-containing protein [Polyangiaceae bacterium]
MIPGFGKQSVLIGAAPHADVQLVGPGVAAEHARVSLEGGVAMLMPLAPGVSVHGAPVAPGAPVPFDFHAQIHVAQLPVPTTHPAFALMLMQRGQAAPTPGRLAIGRDATRCHLVLAHSSVSGLHATLTTEPLALVDEGSSTGTWVGQTKLEPGRPLALTPGGMAAIGPVPISTELARELLAALGAAPAAAAGPSKPKHRTVIGQVQMGAAGAASKTIGRTPDNDIVVPHAQVSSKHAVLHEIGGQLFLEDRGSANGTYVRGARIPPGQRVPVQNGEKVFVGPMPVLLQVQDRQIAVVVEDHSGDWAGRPLYEIEAWDLVVQVPDRDDSSRLKTLLDHVSFKALPGDLIALMGPSGAGKTTLLLTLNGYLPPTAGQVRINGEDLYAIFDALRGSIGYVPQDDIVHPELTVWEAVRYSARFRLPPDYSDDEIDRRVATTLAQLGLESVQHLQIGKPEKKILSGGQRKRVNIAMELVTDPVIMFLDEPTSGLAADDTSALVSLLAELARSTGKTIICTIHQPAKDEYEKFNLALILGQGGIPIYFGPTQDGYRFFGGFLERKGRANGIDNPRDMFDMLNQRERDAAEALRAQNPNVQRVEIREAAARAWNQEFYAPSSAFFNAMYSGRRAIGSGTSQQGVPRRRPSTSGQFGLLLSRYFRVKTRDVSGTVIMLAQAPIIGVLLALVFGGQKDAVPYWCLGALQELARKAGGAGGDVLGGLTPTADHSGALFFLVVSAVWFGTSNAAREIVSERAIYLRERMVNLKLLNYVLSKFLLLSAFCVVQCTVLLGIVFFALGFHGGPQAFGIELAVLIVTAMNSVAIGLLLSTLVMSAEAAMALTPIALIPQVVLGGLMVPITTNPLLEYPMYAVPARWGFQGVVAHERAAVARDPSWVIDLKRPDLTSASDFVTGGRFECATAQMASMDLNGAWGFTTHDLPWLPPAVLAGMMGVVLIGILIILKRRDRI